MANDSLYPMATEAAVALWKSDSMEALRQWKSDKARIRECETLQEMWEISARWYRVSALENITEDSLMLWQMMVLDGLEIPRFLEAITIIKDK